MIIHKESHTDHAINSDQWAHILELFKDRSSFFIETIELPESLGHVMNGLYGPSCGDTAVSEDEVYYAARGPRAWPSRMTKMPARTTRFVRVIAGPHEEKCPRCDGAGEHQTVNGFMHCTQCGGEPGRRGAGTIKHACILYTAYGVHSKDMPAAPKEPGDLLAALRKADAAFFEALDRWVFTRRPKKGDVFEEVKKLQERVDQLKKELWESDGYWAQHALATEAL